MLQFGLRLGNAPQQVVTTTPKPLPVLREIMDSRDTRITRGSTYDNRANLAPTFFGQIVKRFEGTRLGRQELNAELLEEAEGALWSREMIERSQVRFATDELLRESMRRIVVALDPAATSDEGAGEHGIVVVGLGHDGDAYVLEDLSERLSPEKAARKAIAAYDRWQADRIIGETNNGGEWIGHTIAVTAQAMCWEKQRESAEAAYRAVTASRGKQTRAEPVSALYEQGRVHHVGGFPDMEDQLCTWEPLAGQKSPDRLDAMVWGITELMLGGRDVFSADEDFIVKPFEIYDHWSRVFALDVDTLNVSGLWGAWDRESDCLYVYAEVVVPRVRLTLLTEAVRKRGGLSTPGLFDHLGRRRSKAEGMMMTEALMDAQLDIFTVQGDPEAAVSEIASRIATKRLKVFSSCTEWIGQYRTYRRGKDGELLEAADGMMRAMDLLAFPERNFPMPMEGEGDAAQDSWETADRDPHTGY
jgi:hypothetical protein